MKKINSIIIIFALLVLPVLSLNSCEKEELITTVGVVEYAKSSDIHRIYLRPVDQGENGVWIPIVVNERTESVSPFSKDPRNMPELAVGSVVEITYNVAKDKKMPLYAYEAVSVRYAVGTEVEGEQAMPLQLADEYRLTDEGVKNTRDFGTVVHVAKIDTPISGYMIYLKDTKYNNQGPLSIYFIDDNAITHNSNLVFPNDEIKNRIESFEEGYKIAVYGLHQYPFDNLTVLSVLYVTMYNPDYHW